jgi:SNF2 family DNA or RNA helicase
VFSIADYKWPALEGRKPFNHQKATVEFALANKRGFILNDMGTGKTLSVLWACDILFEAKKIRKVLIVGPLSTMRSVWQKEVFFNMPHRRTAIAHGTKAARVSAIKSAVHFVIINHDGIKTCTEELIREQFDIMIIDELTAFKSASSERTKTMMLLANRIKAVWGLTGEPTPNSPIEAYAQCKVVNPTNPVLPRYYTQFRDATMYQINDYLWLPKPGAADIVTRCMQPAIRFRREDCLDLPPTMYQTISVDFTKEQADHYDRMKKEAYVLHDKGEISASSAAIVLNKLLQISAGAVKTNDGEIALIDYKPRFDALVEILQQTPQKKLVVFATYVATIQRLLRDLQAADIRTAAIYGDVDHKQRAQHIEDFQASDLSVLILQPQSSAHGITLVAASTILWFSLIPSNELYRQGNARIVRPGQTRTTFIIHMVSSPAEQHIADILERKGNMSDEVLGLFKQRQI